MVAWRLSDATTLAMLGMTLLKPMGWVTSAPAAGKQAASQHVQAETLNAHHKGLPQQCPGRQIIATQAVDSLLAVQPKPIVAGATMPLCMSGMGPSHSWPMLTNNHERPRRDHAEPLAVVGVQDVVGPAQLGIDFQGQVVGVLPLLLGVQRAVCSHAAGP